uniref:Forkhead box protein O n=1 Tax=Strongyloides ratti TaxID=34506 RepID=A0A7I5WD79_STRRB
MSGHPYSQQYTSISSHYQQSGHLPSTNGFPSTSSPSTNNSGNNQLPTSSSPASVSTSIHNSSRSEDVVMNSISSSPSSSRSSHFMGSGNGGGGGNSSIHNTGNNCVINRQPNLQSDTSGIPSYETGSGASSASSSHTRLTSNGDDSGVGSSHNLSHFEQTDHTTTFSHHVRNEDSFVHGVIRTSNNTEDLEPIERDRCNTWPLRRAAFDQNSNSPTVYDKIPEESDFCDSSENLPLDNSKHELNINNYSRTSSLNNSLLGNRHETNSFTDLNNSSGIKEEIDHMNGFDPSTTPKKTTTRRNAWGSHSYADLITQAIQSSPEQRLTLSQVYEWMVTNVPFFRDKGDSNSSAGWKNSIRHNLSLHNRFMRIQNEGAGKSSWWVINPDAKNGRSQRRQRDRSNTIDTSKSAIDKKRRGAKKKTEHLNVMGLRTSVQSGLNNSIYGSNTPSLSHETFNQDQDDLMSANTFDSFTGFRQRAESNLSVQGNVNGVSPTLDAFDEYDTYPCYDMSSANNGSQVGDILDRTNQMQLGDGGMDPNGYRMNMGTGMINNPMKSIKEIIKPGDMAPQPPPSYHELNSVRNGTSIQQSPLLRTQLNGPMDKNSPSSIQPNGNNPMSPNGGYYNPSYSGQMVHQQMWMSSPMAQPPPAHLQGHIMQHNTMNQLSHHQMQQMNQMQGNNMLSCGAQSGNELPQDLQNLNMIETTQMTEMDFESLMRHEISINSNAPINFDL